MIRGESVVVSGSASIIRAVCGPTGALRRQRRQLAQRRRRALGSFEIEEDVIDAEENGADAVQDDYLAR
jgi:hypothetical protein